jgi:cytochrome c oxidase subunit 2
MIKEKKKLNLRWGYVWTNNEINNNQANLILAAVVFFFIFVTFFSLNILNVWYWEVGFIDPSTSFAESLIKLYNLVWSFLVLILVVVLTLLGRIIYLFNWNLKVQNNFFFNKILYAINYSLLNFGLIVNDKNLIKKFILRLNQLLNGTLDLNIWYNNYEKHEFLLIADLHEYKKLEFIWCVLPTLVLALIAGPSFSLVYSLDSSVNPEINIKVVGKQWYWVYSFDNVISSTNIENNMIEELDKNIDMYIEESLIFKPVNNKFNFILNIEKIKKTVSFNYDSVMINEDDLKEGMHRLLEVNNRLLIPVGVPIRFLITSTDVLHSWSLPSLGLKVDAVPGRLNQFIVEVKRPGIFYGQCSELCGPMHGFMPIVVQAVSFEEYNEWLKSL